MVKSWLKTATGLKVQQFDIQQQALKLTANRFGDCSQFLNFSTLAFLTILRMSFSFNQFVSACMDAWAFQIPDSMRNHLLS